jgi:hypothetical protein
MAVIEIGVLEGQCLHRCIGSHDGLIVEIDARQSERNPGGARLRFQIAAKVFASWRNESWGAARCQPCEDGRNGRE